jgi:ABC-2 type transport system permease protein
VPGQLAGVAAADLAMQVGSALILTLPVIVLIMGAGALINDVRISPASWLLLVPLLWLASLPFTALGIAIAYTLRDEAAKAVTVIFLFLFSIADGLWIPPQVFPSWMRHLADALPSYRGADLGWHVVDGQQPFTSHLPPARLSSLPVGEPIRRRRMAIPAGDLTP